MIHLATKLSRNRQLSFTVAGNAHLLRPTLNDHSAFGIYQPTLAQSYVTFAPRYPFARKKPHIPTKFQQSIDKEYAKQRQSRENLWQKRVYQYGAMNFLPFLGFAILFIFVKAHLAKRHEEATQHQQGNKPLERKNVIVTPELGLRELIGKRDVLDLKIDVLRKNRTPGSEAHSTFCFVTRLNGQNVVAQIPLLSDFLTFVESLQQDYKISFDYKSQKEHEQSVVFKYFVNVSILFLLSIFGRRMFEAARRMLKPNSGGGSMFDIDTKKVEAIKPENINTLFKDVAGMHEAKFQITEFVDFLKQPEKYIEMGAKVPKGALLTGPPGTGKTLLARACAGEAGVPFYYVSGSDFVQKYVGLGASRVRKLFDQAQKNAPSIIFIDQIDAIGKKRDSGPFANEQRDNTLNQLLVRMDGFDSKNKVIVMAATNIKDTLDPALLRPGRFDRAVEIGLPNFDQRKEILEVHLKKVVFDPKFTLQELANRISILTPGFSGAELANICNQAAILAARDGMQSIDMPKFEKATQRVMAGLQKRNLFSDDEKMMLAYYECGKAVVGWFTQGSDPIIKLSILPFSKAAKGYSHTIKDEVGLTTMDQLIGKVCFYLAGRATEQYFKSYVTTNGDADLKRARRIITLLVTKFGMSQRLKHIAFPDIDFVRKPYSSVIQTTIDQEISRITKECIVRVEKLIEEKHDLIERLKVKLLQKETLNHNDIKEVLGARPFESNDNYQKYIVEEQKAHQQEAPVQGEKLEVEMKVGGQESKDSKDSKDVGKEIK